MIGPGWMPSRPRPMAKVRRMVRYVPRGRRKPVVATAAAAPIDAVLFARSQAALPVATLMPRRGEGRRAVIRGALGRWAEARWLWLRPRAIPLVVAFMSLVGVLDARSYLIALARYGTPSITARAPDVPAAIHEISIG